ncbi:MAG: aminodeoxychorismate synthase component I [Smithellaceae bacterium]
MNQDTVLLETIRQDQDNTQNFLFTNPVDVITCRKPADLQKCFRQMENYHRKGFYLAGFFAYELGYFLEESLTRYCPKHDYPLLWFGVYNKPVKRLPHYDKHGNGFFYLSEPKLATNYRQYEKAIKTIKNCIAMGETYQINYTSRYDFNFIGDIFCFYDRLKKHQKVSYSALIHYNGNTIISLSPELFFRVDAKRNIMVKPMKGTAPLGASVDWLRQDMKNTSENVMIVDLLRNDLGRICLPGSVKVKKLFEVEKYETLLQMTSTVTGKLQPQIKIYDMVKSLFPCGSVTGAPKIQSMKIISDLEGEPRNVYTGAIGYFAPDGQAVFNVAIRTIDLQQKPNHNYQARMGIGGGIVNDSQPKDEYAECRLKAQFLKNAMPEFALIETMLFTDGKIKYLNRHLKRLKTSADYFSIPCSIAKIKIALNTYAAKLTGRIRLRLLLKSGGDILIKHQPVVPRPDQLQVTAISHHKTDSGNRFLYHKTTHRELYDAEFNKYSTQGYFDILFRNEKDEITEGAISNIFIQIKTRWYTPPLSCGLLNGITRQVAMKKLNAREKILYLKDLKSADKIILTNSIRGATEVIYQST